ncbi:hypothetical protein N7481_011597 [Penicillium waksmanii]|uniref:uncharacterized protein n=1 Tax=Penicillium waksmanii TaxID=69791 RepID=UPI002547E091|nr:uncharacterized protein N7481_011597 [Penicillium waksmanii]KAJ5974387.1 hypothetical protein N7481_011597 [Penicillium waksmanii]
MSSSSAYEPDEDDSELDSDTALGRARQQRSTSRGRTLRRFSVDSEHENPETEKLQKIKQDRLDALNNLFQDIGPNSLEAYTGLLAEVEKGYDPRNVKEDDELLNVTQDGAVVWTATEKEVLYNFLDRKSANGIKEIATAIGTKSELEVMEHLRVVQRTMRKRLDQRRLRWITVAEIPAAVEIDEGCCAEQEKYAKYLTLKDAIADEHTNQLHYGDYGKIGETEAQALGNADSDTPLQGDLQLAAGLFNTPNWISLSKDFFMNFGGEREADDWRNIAESEEDMPSITADAMMDFSALATSLIRRLIQSSIFMTESRLRTTGITSDAHREIKLGDVQTAIEVLNLKRKRPSFLELARRNRMVIGAFPHKELSRREPSVMARQRESLTHAMEQEKVSHNDAGETVLSERDEDSDEVMDEDGDDSDEDEEDAEDETILDAQNESGHPNTSQHPELVQPGISDGQLAEDKEEEEADNFDREQSRREELRLWSMFEKLPPPALLIPIVESLPSLNEDRKEAMDDAKDDLAQHGISEHRTQEDVVDWRDHTLYRSEWEQYGSDLEDLAEELVQNMKKRRRVEAGDAEDGHDGHHHDDDSNDEAADSSSHSGRGSPVDNSESDDSNSSDDSGVQERGGNQVTASAPALPPAIYINSDDDDNTKVGNLENEAGDESSTDSGSGSESSNESSSKNGLEAGNKENAARIVISSDSGSGSGSDFDSSGGSSSDDEALEAGDERNKAGDENSPRLRF